MSAACKRCGSLDGKHIGYHDEAELPFKRGDRVLVRAGAVIRTSHSDPVKRETVNKRTRSITVISVHNGTSDAPAVVWSGTGGYWHYAAMSDVVPDERSLHRGSPDPAQ